MNISEKDEKIRHELQLVFGMMTAIEPGSVDAVVDSGVVTVTGRVANLATRQSIEHIASRIPGVLEVVNKTMLQPPSRDPQDDAALARAVVDAFGPRSHS